MNYNPIYQRKSLKMKDNGEIKTRLANIGEAIGMIALEYIEKLEQENEQLKQQLENEKQLNAEIKKRLIEVHYDCEEFNHEYCDINCKGKRKELVDLYQLISDGLNETLLKQKEDEIKELKEVIKNLKCCENCIDYTKLYETEGCDCENLCNWRMNNEKKN